MINIAIYVYEGAEVLDVAGPFEVFATAARLAGTSGESSSLNPFLIGQTGKQVGLRGGFRVMPDFGFSSHPSPGVLLVPGGDHSAEQKKKEVANWIKQQNSVARLTVSVCTGAFLLAEAGLLQGLRATTHHEDLQTFAAQFPAVAVEADQRWVDEGRILTSAGISAGIDMSLHIVERLAGSRLSRQTAANMAWDY